MHAEGPLGLSGCSLMEQVASKAGVINASNAMRGLELRVTTLWSLIDQALAGGASYAVL
jgi:hypothetical protein